MKSIMDNVKFLKAQNYKPKFIDIFYCIGRITSPIRGMLLFIAFIPLILTRELISYMSDIILICGSRMERGISAIIYAYIYYFGNK